MQKLTRTCSSDSQHFDSLLFSVCYISLAQLLTLLCFLFLYHSSLIYLHALQSFFLSPVAPHSQSFLFDSLACFTVFSFSSVVSQSQSLLTYRHVLICLPCRFLLCFAFFYHSLFTFPTTALFALQVQKHALTFLSISFLQYIFKFMMENKQLAVAVSENCRIWRIQGLWKSPRRSNPLALPIKRGA